MTKKMELEEKEVELIELLRNIRRAYPNGYEHLQLAAQQVFDDLVDLP